MDATTDTTITAPAMFVPLSAGGYTSPELPYAFNAGSQWRISTSTSPKLPYAFNAGSQWSPSTTTSPDLPSSFDVGLGWSYSSPDLLHAINLELKWIFTMHSTIFGGCQSSTSASTHCDQGPTYSTISYLAVALGSYSTILPFPPLPVDPSSADPSSVRMLLLRMLSLCNTFAATMIQSMSSCWMWELSCFLFLSAALLGWGVLVRLSPGDHVPLFPARCRRSI